jgi:hypothetical protein
MLRSQLRRLLLYSDTVGSMYCLCVIYTRIDSYIDWRYMLPHAASCEEPAKAVHALGFKA